MRTIPSPGEKVAPEGGRKRNAGGNLKVSTTAQAYSRAGCKTIPGKKSVCYPRLNMIARIPLQSPIGSEEPIGDSWELWCDCPRQSLDYGFAARSTTPGGSDGRSRARTPYACISPEQTVPGHFFPKASPGGEVPGRGGGVGAVNFAFVQTI